MVRAGLLAVVLGAWAAASAAPVWAVEAGQREALAEPAAAAEAEPATAQESLAKEPAGQKSAPPAGKTAHERRHGHEPEAASPISRAELDALIAKHARENGVPEPLVRRVIVRESRYDPRLVGKGGAMGLMQIKHATARALGYHGTAEGLLDPETNLTYAVRYLAGAYKAADGNDDRAVAYYAHGYYDVAKRKHITGIEERTASSMPEQPDSADAIY